MLQSYSLTNGLRRLSIGRIIYCVVAALPVAIFLTLWLDPSEPRDSLHDGLLVLVMVILDLPIAIVGIAVLVWSKIRREPLVFWSVATLIASIPIIVVVATIGGGGFPNARTPQ